MRIIRKNYLAGLKLTRAFRLMVFLCVGFFCLFCWSQSRNFAIPSDVIGEHIGKGYYLVSEQRYAEAAREFQVALTLDPHLPRIRYQLAVCLFALGQLKRSRSEFSRLRKETTDSATLKYYIGRIDLRDGSTDSAIRELRSITAHPPFNDAYYYLGEAYFKSNDDKNAEVWLKKAAKITPKDPRVYYALARLYQKLGRTSEAKQEYRLSTDLQGRLLATSQVAMKCDHDLATQSLSKARTVCRQLFDPTNEDKLLMLGMLYGKHGYYNEALEPLDLAARIDPESSVTQHDLGFTLFRLGRYRSARGPLEKAVALRPDFFGSNALLGATLYLLNEDKPSYLVLLHAHELNPQDANTTQLLGRVSLSLAQKAIRLKQYAQSVTFLKEAATLSPSLIEVHRLLEQVYVSLGKSANAAREHKEIERLDRKNQQ